jgi:polysaccharide pyruvyl transferase WcaK-like protein
VRILVDQSGYELLNMGDVAMLQACVRRLSWQWPDAEIMVITHPGTDLSTYVPGARSVGASGQRLARGFPERYRPVWQSIVPYIAGLLPRTPPRPVEPHTTVQAVHAADLVVAAGGGYVTDTWRWHATGVLGVLALAQRLGKPTAMLGQGLGPVTQGGLRAQARWVFPKLAVLGLREGRLGPDLALSFGARADAVTVTGDDALELVAGSPAADGTALGVNLRMAGYAGVDLAAARAVGGVVLSAAAAHRAPVVALPVSRLGADGDLEAIRGMLGRGHPRAEVVLQDLASPQDLIAAAAGCRAMVTGSYHAAVFGLAQGVPAVCVTNSSYYDAKFAGLQALFPHACFISALDQPDFAGRLRSAIDEAWQLPAAERSVTSDAAGDLRDVGRAAYARLREVVDGRPVTITSEAA